MTLRLTQTGNDFRLKEPIGTFSYYHPDHLFRGLEAIVAVAASHKLDAPVEGDKVPKI